MSEERAGLSDVRRRAWETRRRLHGPTGHRGGYARSTRETLALRLIARLHAEGALSEGQCCQALQMDRVAFRAMCDGMSNA